MDSEKTKALLKIINKGSLSAAAEELGYTPSGLSRMVAGLEEEAGVKLLIRGRNGVTMTRECESLIPMYKELIHLEERYKQICSEMSGLQKGTVTVGTAYSIYYKWLSNVIADFSEQYPGIEVKIKHGKSTELYEMMDQHDMDFCIVSRREGEAEWHHLFDDPLVAVVSEDSEIAAKEKFPVKEFEKLSFINTFEGQDTDNARMFEKNKITPNIQFSTEDTYASQRMVEAGLGVSLSNFIEAKERESKGGIKLMKLDPPQIVEIGIATPKIENISPAAAKFREFAMKYLKKLA